MMDKGPRSKSAKQVPLANVAATRAPPALVSPGLSGGMRLQLYSLYATAQMDCTQLPTGHGRCLAAAAAMRAPRDYIFNRGMKQKG